MSAALLVADSGPLIALARVDRLELPARYFESVLVTVTVWEEVTRKPDAPEMPRLTSALAAELIELVPEPESIPDAVLRHTIDAGERGAIALALEMNASLLVDDRRARQLAVELGRPVVGTLGLLLRAREDGVIPTLRPLIEQLQSSGYYLPAGLVQEILAALRE
jgi:predicted nucleic acid-binding protein